VKTRVLQSNKLAVDTTEDDWECVEDVRFDEEEWEYLDEEKQTSPRPLYSAVLKAGTG
jgi:hypothetical protein